MSQTPPMPCTAFAANRRLATGPLAEVARAVKAATDRDPACPVLVFDDATGRVVDLDLRGTPDEVAARLGPGYDSGGPGPRADGTESEPRGRGRPRLGVVGREVTLLPRHWEWLAAQPGGASVTLRKLVEAARRDGDGARRARAARDAAYRFMAAIAGDLPGFEEASRALFAGDRARFEECAAGWPADLRNHATGLAFEPAAG